MFQRLLAMLSLAALAAAAAQAGARRPPNILVLYADDQSYKTVGCYPEALTGAHTPNIDRLARQGIRFHGAFLGAWCTPSRATFLTGRWPHAIESLRPSDPYPSGVYDPKLCPFWPRVFHERGYTTAHIGKWHTGVDAGTGRDWDWQIVWNRPRHPENAGAYYVDQLLSFNGASSTSSPETASARTRPGSCPRRRTRPCTTTCRGTSLCGKTDGSTSAISHPE